MPHDRLVTILSNTVTCEGPIPCLVLAHPQYEALLLPVALKRRAPGSLAHESGLPVPERTADGRLLYALPGGGRFAAPRS